MGLPRRASWADRRRNSVTLTSPRSIGSDLAQRCAQASDILRLGAFAAGDETKGHRALGSFGVQFTQFAHGDPGPREAGRQIAQEGARENEAQHSLGCFRPGADGAGLEAPNQMIWPVVSDHDRMAAEFVELQSHPRTLEQGMATTAAEHHGLAVDLLDRQPLLTEQGEVERQAHEGGLQSPVAHAAL